MCLSELRIKISMLSVSSAPHAALRWKIKAISTCTINYIVTFMLAWRLWIVHLRMRTAWCPSPFHRKYRMFNSTSFPTNWHCVQVLCLVGRQKKVLWTKAQHERRKFAGNFISSAKCRKRELLSKVLLFLLPKRRALTENFIMKSVLLCWSSGESSKDFTSFN